MDNRNGGRHWRSLFIMATPFHRTSRTYRTHIQYVQYVQYVLCVHTRANALRAASTVRSMISSVCAVETKAASNCDGARYTPSSSMAWKNRAKASRSLRLAVAQSRTVSEVKKLVNIEPTRLLTVETPASRAASVIPATNLAAALSSRS